jgi:hypothetical protein
MEWPKGELAKEVARLRAVLHEFSTRDHAEPRSGGDSVDVAGDPYARGGVVMDTRGAVLMDANEVILVDLKRPDDPPAMALIIEGRVNLKAERVKQMYLFGTDGAAGLVTEIIGLAQRAGGRFATEFLALFDQRMNELP